MTDSFLDPIPSQMSDADIPAEFNLDVPDDIPAIARDFWNEWCNGGFAQLFSNWYPADVKLISRALREVGAPEAAAIVEKAIAELANAGSMAGSGPSALINSSDPLHRRLYELDREFDSHERHLEKRIADYELKLSEA